MKKVVVKLKFELEESKAQLKSTLFIFVLQFIEVREHRDELNAQNLLLEQIKSGRCKICLALLDLDMISKEEETIEMYSSERDRGRQKPTFYIFNAYLFSC